MSRVVFVSEQDLESARGALAGQASRHQQQSEEARGQLDQVRVCRCCLLGLVLLACLRFDVCVLLARCRCPFSLGLSPSCFLLLVHATLPSSLDHLCVSTSPQTSKELETMRQQNETLRLEKTDLTVRCARSLSDCLPVCSFFDHVSCAMRPSVGHSARLPLLEWPLVALLVLVTDCLALAL
jgi:hypothetical protein